MSRKHLLLIVVLCVFAAVMFVLENVFGVSSWMVWLFLLPAAWAVERLLLPRTRSIQRLR